jgi:DNA-binding transcriptional ArsR family regulator
MSNGKMNRPLSDGELDRIAWRFKLLGEPMRLKILQAVCREPATVGRIVSAVGATQANVSKHLSLLAAAGILTRKKDGQCVYYGLKDPLTMKMCELVHNQLAVNDFSRAPAIKALQAARPR